MCFTSNVSRIDEHGLVEGYQAWHLNTDLVVALGSKSHANRDALRNASMNVAEARGVLCGSAARLVGIEEVRICHANSPSH